MTHLYHTFDATIVISVLRGSNRILYTDHQMGSNVDPVNAACTSAQAR